MGAIDRILIAALFPCVFCGIAQAGVIFNSQNRFIQSAHHDDPLIPGPMFPPNTTILTDIHAPDFGPFNHLTGALASAFGVYQESSLSDTAIVARGWALASPEFQGPGTSYYHYYTAQSHFAVTFTLSALTNYTLTQNAKPPGSNVPVSPYTIPFISMATVTLDGPGGQTLTFPGAPGASPVVTSGTLAAGQWSMLVDASNVGQWQGVTGVPAYDATLAVPEPAGVALLSVAVGAVALVRGRRAADVDPR